MCAIVYNKIIEVGWMFDLLDQIEMLKDDIHRTVILSKKLEAREPEVTI